MRISSYKHSTLIISVLILLCVTLSCDRWFGKSSIKAKIEEDRAVCIRNKLPLLKKPRADAERISALYLGESFQFTDKQEKGKADGKATYVKVKLADGTEGWITEEGIIKNSVSGVIKAYTRIYERPERMTILDSTYDYLDIVAVTHEKDDWVKVIGENRSTGGWIKNETVSTDKNEVAAAILVKKELTADNTLSLRERVTRAILDSPYPDSYVIQTLRKLSVLYRFESEADKGAALDFNIEVPEE